MSNQQAYMIIDIGTGNVRVAITSLNGEVLSVERDNVIYSRDSHYHDALDFSPEQLWGQIISLAKKNLAKFPSLTLKAITASSQREGIVLVSKNGKSLIGLPNHDHRGLEFEDIVKDQSRVYKLTGRYPGWLFSAMKFVGIKNKRPDLFEACDFIISISDWAQYKLSGIAGYEHSQASETQLYDIEKKSWSDELCDAFGIEKKYLPPLHNSGTILGNLLPEIAEELSIPETIPVIVGGADTQLAIKSTMPKTGDVIIVSGTTTPITMVVDQYIIDDHQKTWTGRHIDEGKFILEANAGVTGLNYQRLKEIFYPNEDYTVIEKELKESSFSDCVASLGSLIADDTVQLNKGGFIFNTPVPHDLRRSSFVKAALIDIACSIKENFETLNRVNNYDKDYVWACGGGFQSLLLTQYIAGLINKKVLLREGYGQASVAGGAVICSEVLNHKISSADTFKEILPENQEELLKVYKNWKALRSGLKEIL